MVGSNQSTPLIICRSDNLVCSLSLLQHNWVIRFEPTLHTKVILCTRVIFKAKWGFSKISLGIAQWAICLKWFLCSERTINDSVQPLFCFQTILRTNCWKVFWTFCWLRKVLSVNFRIVWERLSLDKTPNKFNCLLPACTQIFKWTCKQADFKKYQMHPVL